MTMNPSTQSHPIGEQFTIEMMVDANSSQVNYIGIDVPYDASLYDVVSFQAGSLFPRTIYPFQSTNGHIIVGVATPVGGSAVTGPALVGTLVLKGKANTSSPTVFSYDPQTYVGTFDPTSESANNILAQSSGASVTIETATSSNNCQIAFTLTIPTATPTNTPIPTNTPTPTRTPTPTPSSTPTPTPVPQCGSACTTNAQCPTNHSCSGNVCILSACTNSSVSCTADKCAVLPTSTPTNTPTPIPQCGSACTTNAQCPTNHSCSGNVCILTACTNSSVNCSTDKCEVLPTNTPTPTTPIGPQCLALKIYQNGQYIPDPRVIQPGQTIQIGVAAGQFAERARVWINDQGPFEFTDRNVDNEFVYTYTIPSTATSISIRAEIYANGVWQISQ